MLTKKNYKDYKKSSRNALLALALAVGFSSCSTDQELLTDNDENLNTATSNAANTAAFVPSTGSLYRITPLELDRQIGANGGANPFINSGSVSFFSDQLKWEFSATSTDGNYYLDSEGGDNRPRISANSNNSSFPTMSSASTSGLSAEWNVTNAGSNTYFLTTNSSGNNRLSLGEFGYLRMVPGATETTSEQFIITEIDENENLPPVANDDNASNHAVGDTVEYSVLDNDTDPNGDKLTILQVIGGSPNVVKWDGGDTITVTRVTEFTRTVRYQVSDGNGGTSWGALNLRYTGGNNG